MLQLHIEKAWSVFIIGYKLKSVFTHWTLIYILTVYLYFDSWNFICGFARSNECRLQFTMHIRSPFFELTLSHQEVFVVSATIIVTSWWSMYAAIVDKSHALAACERGV